MANEKIKSKFITVDEAADFEDLLGSTARTISRNGQYIGSIPYDAIVFIKDTKEIWNCGTYYSSPTDQFEFEVMPTNVNLRHDNWTQLSFTEWDGLTSGSYVIQAAYQGMIYTGFFSFVKQNQQDVTNDADDEIALHMSGKFNTIGGQTVGRLFLKIKDAKLYASSTVDHDGAEINLKIKKLL